MIREDVGTFTEATGNWRTDIIVPAEGNVFGRADAPINTESLQAGRADLSIPDEDVAVGTDRSDVPISAEFMGALREDASVPNEAAAISYGDSMMPASTSGILYADVPLQFVWTITGYGDYLVGGESQQEAAKWDAITWLEYSSDSNIVVVNEDVFTPLSWEALPLIDTAVPAESTDAIQGDVATPAEGNISMLADVAVLVLESGTTLRTDATVPVEAVASVRAVTPAGTEWLNVVYADRTTALENTKGELRDVSIDAENLQTVRTALTLPIETVAQTFMQMVDYSVGMEWTIAAFGDAPAPSEWTAREGPYTVISLAWKGPVILPRFGPAIATRSARATERTAAAGDCGAGLARLSLNERHAGIVDGAHHF